MMYTITFRRSVKKDMRRISRAIIPRIEDAIHRLRGNPFPVGSIQLNTERGRYYRIRVGGYRIIYEVAQEIRIITVIRVGHRGEVYRGL